MFEKTGLVNVEMAETILPSEERRRRKPYAIFECFQEIPCNPCFTGCKPGAVIPFEDINDIPKIDYERCTGCAQCVSVCPGLACFVIDETYSDTEASIKLPYEFLPLPAEGQQVTALDREGNEVGTARVVKVQCSKKLDHTNIITIAVPKDQVQIIRGLRLEGSR